MYKHIICAVCLFNSFIFRIKIFLKRSLQYFCQLFTFYRVFIIKHLCSLYILALETVLMYAYHYIRFAVFYNLTSFLHVSNFLVIIISLYRPFSSSLVITTLNPVSINFFCSFFAIERLTSFQEFHYRSSSPGQYRHVRCQSPLFSL